MSARIVFALAAMAGTCSLLCTSSALAGGCTPSTGPDVIVGQINGVSSWGSVGNVAGYSVGTDSCNIGSVNLLWIAGSVNHPVIPQNIYRYKVVNGYSTMEQLGQGWMKHAFTALTQNLCCTCNGAGGTVLGVGCSDPYTSGRNGTQCNNTGGMGPKFEVNAHTGGITWPYTFRNNCTYMPHNALTRRIQVQHADLDAASNPGALYYAEAQYVTPDDAAAQNQNNNASHRRVTVTAAGGTYSLSITGTTVRENPAIKAWKLNDPSVVEVNLTTPEATNPNGGDNTGFGILAADATDLGGGVWHYEYNLYNMNSDRSFSSFSIPSSGGLIVSSQGFRDVPYHSGDGYQSTATVPVTFDGTDWTPLANATEVSWTMVPATPVGNSNALRWATMYTFRFNANSPPTTGSATIGMFKAVAGQPNFFLANGTVVPTGINPCPADVNGSGGVDINDLLAVVAAWGTNNAAADINDDGTVNITDLLGVIAAWGACP